MSASPMAVLEIKDVTKTFGSFTAIDSINLEVRSGEIFGFLGPNGAGKSTTIRLLLDILRPDSGSISLLGKPNRQTLDVHRDIGFLSGDMTLDTDLTGRQYLEFVNNLHGGNHHGTITRLSELLESNPDKKIGDYSRGNRQKIGLIASILHNPKLLILDEPTSGFDPLVQEKFATIIREYVAEGGSVFMSSHVLGEVQHLCDRVAFIKDGKIVTTKSVHELLGANAKRVIIMADVAEMKRIMKDYGTVTGLALVENGVDSLTFSFTGDPKPVLQYFASKNVSDITIREPELEEIFSHYYESQPEQKS
jgi:ABC-2 type transport system ATP-binding protein